MTDDTPFASLGFAEEAAVFVSASQNARVLTEGWVGLHLYCPNCGADHVNQHPNNTAARDFFCETCAEDYELKAGKGGFTRKVPDGAYGTSSRPSRSGATPTWCCSATTTRAPP